MCDFLISRMDIPKKLIREICLRLLIRGNRQWDGKEARRVVASSHTALNVKTNKEDFRRLVISVHRLGKVMDFSYEKQTYIAIDWESFRLRISEILGNLPCRDGCNFLIERLQGTVGSYSLEKRGVTDWVEVINRLQNQHNINLESFSLEEKIEICEVIEDFLEKRTETKAICAATDMGITIEDLYNSLEVSLKDVEYLKTNEKVSEGHMKIKKILGQEAFQEIMSLSDTRSADEISSNLIKYPDALSKTIVRRWRAFKEDVIAEKLWSKSIKGTSGLVREMVICIMGMGTHYRVLYKTDKNTEHPFLAVGLRRDLFSMVEKSKHLVL